MAIGTPVCDFGWQPPEFSLLGIDGKTWSLGDIRGENGTLLMFICNHCPYVKSVSERIVRDAKALQQQGVGVAAIMSNDWTAYPEDTPELMIEFANSNGFTFPYLIDEDQSVARAYDAVCTPDFFGFNGQLTLQYRGRLDASRKDAAPEGTRRDLFEAMSEIIKSGHGPKDQIASMGCGIKWRDE